MEILSKKSYEIFLNNYFSKVEAMEFAQMYCKMYRIPVLTQLIRRSDAGWGTFLRKQFTEEFERAYSHFITTDFYVTYKNYFYELDGIYYNAE